MNTRGNAWALMVDRGITSEDVIDTLAELFAMRGVPKAIRSDNGRSLHRARFGSGSDGSGSTCCTLPRESVGEWLCRKLPLEAQRRVPGPGTVREPTGCSPTDGGLERGLQP